MTSSGDSGLQCLVLIAALHEIAADEAQLAHEFRVDGRDVDTTTLLLAARGLGFEARSVQQNLQRLDRAPLPAIAQDRDGGYFVAARFDKPADGPGRLLVQYPGHPPRVKLVDELLETWTGQLVFLKSKASYAGEMARFDFSWFVPPVVKYRRLLGDVLLISLALQVIGLCTPLFFQVVMDKVLVNHALKTLDVIAVGLLCAIAFEATLTGIRSWIFAHTSSKIDVELGARLFRHLLALPISYFQSRRVGDSVARIRELENIRSFLTSNALTIVMDLLFSSLFLVVMLWYSPMLTLVVLATLPAYVTLSLLVTPVLRARLAEKFNRSAENQSFLVETLGGIETIKSMAVEPGWIRRWEQQLAGYVTAGLGVTTVAAAAGSGVNFVGKLATAAIMWLGATQVIDHRLTVGELVAFNMLAGQVAAPVLRLAQLWNDFQQVGISMQRLADILDARTETAASRSRLPRLQGGIEFDKVSFRYRADAPDVIRSLDLRIAPGEMIGIVGRSGSGKSTLTKLVQRLYVPDRGRVLVDGHDLSIIDTTSLRRQVGVVLQDNMLFSRSIRDNISLANPALPIEAVIEVARLAGAHEFICELPEGYDTRVGEHGTGLSGGQRQRIAIARALVGDPRILIFDEATSALDYESEKIVQDHMQEICRGRTVLVIAHRLSAVRHADRIVVMERGEVAECGTHSELLAQPDGLYAHLHRLQQQTGGTSPPPPAPLAVRPAIWQAEFGSSIASPADAA
jgi:subfamily B ATP-binding cassette protein HlyB/CyaB